MKSNLHNRIMRRVYFTYAKRLAISAEGISAFGFLASLVLLQGIISIGDVLSNMPKGGKAFFSFWMQAFQNTELAVYIALFCAVLFASKITQGIIRYSLVRETALR